jgi:hypothetical protein
LRSVCRLLVTASVVPSSPILVTLMEALRSSETSVLTRATRLTFQKTPFFIVTAVKTSNHTYKIKSRTESSSVVSAEARGFRCALSFYRFLLPREVSNGGKNNASAFSSDLIS